MELWTLARKPLEEDTIAKNVLKYGTGGINIDASRVPTEEEDIKNLYRKPTEYEDKDPVAGMNASEVRGSVNEDYKKGRFPANFIHDGSDEVVSLFPDSNGAGGSIPNSKITGYGENLGNGTYEYYGGDRKLFESGSGSASRFFYVAKASKKERDLGLEDFEKKEIRGGGRAKDGYATDDPEQQRLKDAARKFGAVKVKKGNIHPTVKPIKLMRYLVNLVNPKGGIVLDLFAGSGSTLIGAKMGSHDYFGIECEEDYVNIINHRLKAWNPED